MAVYKIFPNKDATIYSSNPTLNTGLDAICEVNTSPSNTSRFLTHFSQNEIQDVIDNKISGSVWNVSFNNFIADANGISFDSYIEIFPISQDWDNGTGEFGDTPTQTNGASWQSTDKTTTTLWVESGSIGDNHITSSFQSTTPGGGSWFYSGSQIQSYAVTQSFGLRSDKDINVEVKNIVERWYDGSLPNYGFIVKFEDTLEFNSSQNIQPSLKYFSVDTNTIYPPSLEFKWVDYESVLTGSESNILGSDNISISLNENPNIFYKDSINKFKINCSPTYPIRVFQTSSLFTNQYYLPPTSYYAIKDLDTNEFIINFDEEYTQISSDYNGNYFNVIMDGLEPERYYKIQIKTISNGSVKIYDDNYYFKVIN